MMNKTSSVATDYIAQDSVNNAYNCLKADTETSNNNNHNSKKWRCKFCTYDNFQHDISCAMCLMEKTSFISNLEEDLNSSIDEEKNIMLPPISEIELEADLAIAETGLKNTDLDYPYCKEEADCEESSSDENEEADNEKSSSDENEEADSEKSSSDENEERSNMSDNDDNSNHIEIHDSVMLDKIAEDDTAFSEESVNMSDDESSINNSKPTKPAVLRRSSRIKKRKRNFEFSEKSSKKRRIK